MSIRPKAADAGVNRRARAGFGADVGDDGDRVAAACALISAAVSLTSASDRAAQITLAPSRAKYRLIARPMPLLAPVMIATRPSSMTHYA